MSKTRVTIGKVSGAIKVHYDGGVIWLERSEANELRAQLERAVAVAVSTDIDMACDVASKVSAFRLEHNRNPSRIYLGVEQERALEREHGPCAKFMGCDVVAVKEDSYLEVA